MLWIINGLIYGFFTALYTLANQKAKLNGYILGIWRGFGIAIIFTPLLLFIPPLTDYRNWILLISQGIFIGIYDSHIFFASARFGANTTSRLLVLSVPLTTLLWWILTPSQFTRLYENANTFITLLLCLIGFCICYWYMLKSSLTKKAFLYMTPAVISLAAMSIMTKEIAVMKQNVWHNIIYYLVVSTFISGCYNLILFLFSRNKSIKLHRQLFSSAATHIGCYVITFSAALITAKTLALRIAPNPGYVVTLLLTAPLFVFMLSPQTPHREILSEKAGLAMLFFLCLIMLLTTSDIGIND